MKKLSFNEVLSMTTLSHNEMKNVKAGGGTCGFINYDANGTVTSSGCGVTKAEALHMQANYEGGHSYWCCDSCASTHYCG